MLATSPWYSGQSASSALVRRRFDSLFHLPVSISTTDIRLVQSGVRPTPLPSIWCSSSFLVNSCRTSLARRVICQLKECYKKKCWCLGVMVEGSLLFHRTMKLYDRFRKEKNVYTLRWPVVLLFCRCADLLSSLFCHCADLLSSLLGRSVSIVSNLLGRCTGLLSPLFGRCTGLLSPLLGRCTGLLSPLLGRCTGILSPCLAAALAYCPPCWAVLSCLGSGFSSIYLVTSSGFWFERLIKLKGQW